MNDRKMIIGMHLSDSCGVHPGAWRMPGVDPKSYTNINTLVGYAQAADRGGLQFIFMPDRPLLDADLSEGPPRFQMDPMLALTAIARATQRIGLIASVSTSLTEPYTIARQLKALDVMSDGRAGWNAIATNDPGAFANYGQQMPSRQVKYARLHEMIQLVQALWGSWERDAGDPDQEGVFADPARIQPINLFGQHVGSLGPLPIPPSEQGQPVIFQAGGGGAGLQAAARYADVVVGMPMTIEQGRSYRDAVRGAVVEAGRDADEVKLLMFASFAVSASAREAVDRRRRLDSKTDLGPSLDQLSTLLNLSVHGNQLDTPLTSGQLGSLRPNPADARSMKAVALAREGWSPLDILAHGVFDVSPGVVGTAEQAADFLEQWFEAGATDGFILSVDALHDGLSPFLDEVIPLLRTRGLFDSGHETVTLRHHLGVPFRYGA